VPSEGGRTTKKLILDMIEAARALSREPHTYWTDQLNNHDSIAGYHPLGEEIWHQTGGRLTAFVHCVGTAATIRGVATVLITFLMAREVFAGNGWLALAAAAAVGFVPRFALAGSMLNYETALAFFAALLYLPQFMEKQLGYSPLEAGVGMLPFLATFALVSFVAGPLYNRLGAKTLVVFGAACITLAPFLFSQVDSGSGYDSLIVGMVVLGIGIGSFYPTATTAGVTSVDESQTSLAGGIVYMFQIAGGAVGLGVATAIFTSSSEDWPCTAHIGTSLISHV